MGFETTRLEERDHRMVGKWRSALSGGSIKSLSPEEDDNRQELWLYANGRARWGYSNKKDAFREDPADATSKTEWSVNDGRTLVITVPIPPMPEYEVHEWDEDDVLSKGFDPDGYDEGDRFRVYRYKPREMT